jgi:hypothetical protein
MKIWVYGIKIKLWWIIIVVTLILTIIIKADFIWIKVMSIIRVIIWVSIVTKEQ